jgi:hypothetical protein
MKSRELSQFLRAVPEDDFFPKFIFPDHRLRSAITLLSDAGVFPDDPHYQI